MDQINSVIKGFQKKFLNYFRSGLDRGYVILTDKKNSLSNEEESFMEIY